MSTLRAIAAAAPAAHFWTATAVVAVGALVGFARSFRLLRRTRLIEDTPTARLRSAPQGYIELEGHARLLPGDPIVAPLSGVRCVWWRYRIQERESSGRPRWDTIASGTSDSLFELDDGSGRCVVDPVGARVIPSVRRVWTGNTANAPPPLSTGGGWIGRLPFGRYRYTEELLEAGTPLYALGWFRTDGGAEGSDQAAVQRELLIEWKRDQPALLARFDRNHDGLIDGEEWESARAAAAAEARREAVAQPVGPDVNVLSRPPDRRNFLLSGKTQRDLIACSRRSASITFLLALAATAVVTWLLGARGLL